MNLSSAGSSDQSPKSPVRTTRRAFNRKVALGAFAAQYAATFLPASAFGRLERPALAGIGAGGKGRTDIEQSKKAGFEITALVDVVDATKLGEISERRLRSMAEVRKSFPKAAFYHDYREMLADLGDRIDAVTVSTPDHHHFHASALAMKAGKHVYCQKPLTHSIWEARKLTELAEQTGVKTQMGNQAHANNVMRECVELVRSGVIGPIKEIHAWTNRPIWPQGFTKPPQPTEVPRGIDWKQWIGPAPFVTYSPKIAPFSWRGWWDYGTGALGDMACHIMDMGYWAMGLPQPRAVKATQEGATRLSPPINSKIEWTFGPGPHSAQDGFRYFWYDGYVDAEFDRESWSLKKNGDEYNHPGADVLGSKSFKDFGSVLIGEHGRLFFHRSKGWKVEHDSGQTEFETSERTVPRANGDSYGEWLAAINGEISQSESHFGQSGPLTETVLLGVLAQRFPNATLKWNADKMQVEGRPELQSYIQRDYADGWQIEIA